MLKELLEKRISEYESATKEILEPLQEKLVKALRNYSKTDDDIVLSDIQYYHNNKNFVVIDFVTTFKIGDTIRTTNGKTYKVTEENIDSFQVTPIKIVLSIQATEKMDARELANYLDKIDAFIKEYGTESYHKYLSSGIEELDDITYEMDAVKTLDVPDNPISVIVDGFDDLQKFQYMVFSKTIPKVLN
jgi:hypothetical protein